MANRDFCQVYLRGFVEEINRLTQFLEATPSSVLLKGDSEEEKGYIKKEIGKELYEIELRKLALTPQIIEKFPLLRITGLCEVWERFNNHAESFYSESGSSDVQYRNEGYFDSASDERWTYNCCLFKGCAGETLNIKTGEYEDYGFTYPYNEQWNGALFCREQDGKMCEVHAKFFEEHLAPAGQSDTQERLDVDDIFKRFCPTYYRSRQNSSCAESEPANDDITSK